MTVLFTHLASTENGIYWQKELSVLLLILLCILVSAKAFNKNVFVGIVRCLSCSLF